MAHAITTALDTSDAVECIECGVVCQDDDQVIAHAASGREITAADLLPPCPGVGPLQAHHFAPVGQAIVCQWCQGEITPHSAPIPDECIRPE